MRPIVLGEPLSVPLVSWTVQAGFPSPAEDHSEGGLDLSRKFVHNPTATFVVRATGKSLTGVGIFPDDYLLVDRSKTPKDGDVVVAIVDGAFTAKLFAQRQGRIVLLAANPAYPPIPWADGCEIWGVVTSVHRDLAAAR
jgi:DNA polymerase V